MQLTPFQLGLLIVGGFTGIVLLNILARYQSSEEFRTQLSNMSPTDLIKIRTQRIREEQMEPVAAAIDNDDGDEDAENN